MGSFRAIPEDPTDKELMQGGLVQCNQGWSGGGVAQFEPGMLANSLAQRQIWS